MSDEQRHSADESGEPEREETMQDLDVSQDEAADVKGGFSKVKVDYGEQ